MNENENGRKRREWVKTAAIVFLSILLVLTFFSNTIMNYSLPEVAAQYIQSGTITAKIRGTGTVESSDPYKVQVKETRTVESVLVKVGDEVQKGDPLFTLADKESQELTDAQKQLNTALLNFEKQILSGTISNTAVNNAQSGRVSSIAGYQSKIVAAETEIEKWQAEVDYATDKLNHLGATKDQLADSGDPDTTAEQNKVNEAQNNLNNDEIKIAYDKIAEWSSKKAECDALIAKHDEGIAGSVSGNDIVNQVSEGDYKLAIYNSQQYANHIKEYQDFINNNPDKVTNFNNLQKALADAQIALANKQASKNNDQTSVNTQVRNWTLEKTAREAKLKEAQDNKTQLLADIAAELDLSTQLKDINEQREKIAELAANATGATIEAPISGTVTAVNVTAGQDTPVDSPIATMQPEGKGYTMSFSVTNDQAKKLSVGIVADLVNSWRYDDVTVTLASIKPDTTDPSQKKLLTFDVTGSVTAGQSLNVAVGDKSANYDQIVPNSAIREDNNGKFILYVESKSSPLGNRYIARRADIEVLASDDTQSAISGGLYGYEFVITTSTKPVEAGQQVRLAEGSN